MDLMKKEVIVLNAMQYQMTDTETGEVNEGTSVRYVLRNSKKGTSWRRPALVSIILMISLRFPESMKLIWMSGSIRTEWPWLLPTASPLRSH